MPLKYSVSRTSQVFFLFLIFVLKFRIFTLNEDKAVSFPPQGKWHYDKRLVNSIRCPFKRTSNVYYNNSCLSFYRVLTT